MAYGVARGDDKGAEEAAVLGVLDADAAEDEGVVEVEAGRGGSRDLLRGGGGLEAAPHRVRVHGRRRAGPARTGGRTTGQTKRAMEFVRQATDKTIGLALPTLTGGATNGYFLCLGVRTNGYLVVGPASGSSSFFLPLFNIKKLYWWCTLGVHFFLF